jgi:hypothetical protein
VKLTFQNAPLSVAFDAQVRPDSLSLRSLELKGFGGSTSATSSLSLTGSKPFSSDTTSSNLSIEALLSAFKPDLRQYVSGTITSCKLPLKGALGGEIARNTSTSGPASLAVRNALLKGTNLPQVILTKVDSVPFLEGSLRQFVPKEFERFLSSPDTEIRELTTSFTILNGSISFSNIALTSDIFSLAGNGTVSPDGALSLNTTFFFTREFSEALTQRNKKSKALLAADGRLIVPLAIRGKAPTIGIYPDLAKIIETGAAKALQDKAVSALERALGNSGKKDDNKKRSGFGKALGGALGF